MVALTRCLCSLALLGNTAGVRVIKKSSAPKFIADVPVLNYPLFRAAPTEQEWVVMAKEHVTDMQIEEMCGAAKNGCDFTGGPSEGGVPFFEMRGTESDLEAVLRKAGGPDNLEYVEVDQLWYPLPESDAEEDKARRLWGLTRIGASKRTSTGKGVKVFVLDTGVRHSHNQIRGRALSGADASSGRLRDCKGAKDCAVDRHGHGTHCAGTVAGKTYGVAPGAAIRGVKVLGDDGPGYTSWITAGIDFVAKKFGKRVASLSLGGPGNSRAYKTAIDSAVNAGVIVVVAAGNDNDNACDYSPAYVPSAITVGSTDSRDRRSSFSNYGRCVDIWAPGSSILSAGYKSDTASSTKSGTSMACPHVAGGAALVLEKNPGFKQARVLSALKTAAIKGKITGLKSGDTNQLLYVGGR